MKAGSLNLLEPLGPPQEVKGIALPSPLLYAQNSGENHQQTW
jgi:hypothetical protein